MRTFDCPRSAPPPRGADIHTRARTRGTRAAGRVPTCLHPPRTLRRWSQMPRLPAPRGPATEVRGAAQCRRQAGGGKRGRRRAARSGAVSDQSRDWRTRSGGAGGRVKLLDTWEHRHLGTSDCLYQTSENETSKHRGFGGHHRGHGVFAPWRGETVARRGKSVARRGETVARPGKGVASRGKSVARRGRVPGEARQRRAQQASHPPYHLAVCRGVRASTFDKGRSKNVPPYRPSPPGTPMVVFSVLCCSKILRDDFTAA